MGSADPRAYARNKRGIAGNLIWINFDRDSLLALVEQAGGKFVADVDEIRPQFVGNDQISPSSQSIFATSITRTTGPSIGSTIDTFNQIAQTGVNDFAATATPWYHDQILPFDITLSGVNEQTATFVARSVELNQVPLVPHPKPTRAGAKDRSQARSQLRRKLFSRWLPQPLHPPTPNPYARGGARQPLM